LPDHDVLERSGEMAQIDALLANVGAGEGSVVVLTGPAGIGKSTLLSVGAAKATDAGCFVMAAQGRPLEQEYAFGVALQLFEVLAAREDLFAGSAGLARRLLDPVGRDRLLDGDSFPIIHGLYWLTERLAEERPVVMVVDDLQWVDEPSLRVLAYLAERLGMMPVGMLAAVRPPAEGGAPPAYDDALRWISAASVVALPALTPSAVESLATSIVGGSGHHDSLARACHKLTAGNPLLVVESLREVAASGVLPVGDPGGPPEALLVPSVRRRLEHLPEHARRLAAAAVVVGGGPCDVVAEVAGLAPTVAAVALRQLRSAALIEPDDPVRVTHAIVGDALESDLGVAAREALHGAAFEALDRRGAPLDVMAAHAVAAPAQGSPRIVDVLMTAARASVRRGRPALAVTQLQRALAEPPPEELRAELLSRLARSEAVLGDPGWRGDLDSAVVLNRASEPQARLHVANALLGSGALPQAAEQFELGLRSVDDPTSDLALRLLAGLSQTTLIDVTNDRSVLDRAEAALGPEPQGDTRARRDLLRHVAYARALSDGTRSEVLDLAYRATRGDDLDGIDLGSTVVAGVLALLFADDEDVLPGLLDGAIEGARASGRLGVVAGLSIYRGARRTWCGEIDAAIADLSLARAGLVQAWGGVLPGASGNLALAYLERDDLGAAEQSLELSGAIGTYELGASFNSWLWARSQVRAARGDLAGALADALECGRRERRMGSLNPATIPWEFTAGDLLARSGRGEEARVLTDEALDRARYFGAPRTLGHGLRAAAAHAPASMRLELLNEAVDVLSGTPWRLERTRVTLELGRQLVAGGQRREGARLLRDALDVAHDLGLRRLADQATVALRGTGARPRRPRITGPEALTPTERLIAELAASGMTNREIAEHRFVTMKAVEFHLGNAYRKLAIRNRSGLEQVLGEAR
jgi:DNA-binding CsgD family transcriptional regulator